MCRWASAHAVLALALLGGPSLSYGQAVEVLAWPQFIPVHSTGETLKLPPPTFSSGARPVTVKPLRVPDPAGLQQWKDALRNVPGILRSPPQFVPDAPAPAAQISPPSVQFEGLSNSDNAAVAGSQVVPPDSNLGVGPSHIFQMVNIVGRITNKSGAAAQSFTLRTFF